MAHFWLWGRWSFEESLRDTLLLLVTSVLLIVYLAVPIRALVKKQSPNPVFHKFWMQVIFYVYVILIVVMSLFHFTGLIKLLLPIKIGLLGLYAFIKYKLKSKK